MNLNRQIAFEEKRAAKMLDLSPENFRQLVEEGILPRARRVGPFERWDADELRAVMRGDPYDGYEDTVW